MSDKEPVRIAMLGAKHGHGAGKARWLRDLPHVDFVGAYEPDAGVRAERDRQMEYQNVRWLSSIDTILDDDSIVGVVVDGAEAENPSYARRALAAAKHVLMEKSCGWTKAHADELIGTAERKGLVFQMAYNYRFMPHIKRVLDMAAAGEFGDIHTVRIHLGSSIFRREYTRLPDGRPYFRGGFMYNLGGHALDLVMAVLGVAKAVHPFLRCDFYREDSYPDNIHVVLEYERAIGVVEINCLEVEGARPKSFEVYGSEAQAIVSPVTATGGLCPAVAVHTGGREAGVAGWRTFSNEPWENHRPDIEEFVASIRGEKQPWFSYEHDRAVQHVLMDICGESDHAETAR